MRQSKGEIEDLIDKLEKEEISLVLYLHIIQFLCV